MTLIRKHEDDLNTFQHGLRCEGCGVLMVDLYGVPVEGAPDVWEYREHAVPLLASEREADSKFAWIWTLVCKGCAEQIASAAPVSIPTDNTKCTSYRVTAWGYVWRIFAIVAMAAFLLYGRIHSLLDALWTGHTP